MASIYFGGYAAMLPDSHTKSEGGTPMRRLPPGLSRTGCLVNVMRMAEKESN